MQLQPFEITLTHHTKVDVEISGESTCSEVLATFCRLLQVVGFSVELVERAVDELNEFGADAFWPGYETDA